MESTGETKKRYVSQSYAYQKARREADPEYKAKCNAKNLERNKARYNNDEEYRKQCLAKHKARNDELRAVYKQFKAQACI